MFMMNEQGGGNMLKKYKVIKREGNFSAVFDDVPALLRR